MIKNNNAKGDKIEQNKKARQKTRLEDKITTNVKTYNIK